MKNKKPKTIEDIVYSAFYDNSRLKVIRYCNEDEWPIKEVSEQIKQLIADEVIGKDEFWADEYNTEGTSLIDVDKYKFQARAVLRKQQRKKLERL